MSRFNKYCRGSLYVIVRLTIPFVCCVCYKVRFVFVPVGVLLNSSAVVDFFCVDRGGACLVWCRCVAFGVRWFSGVLFLSCVVLRKMTPVFTCIFCVNIPVLVRT